MKVFINRPIKKFFVHKQITRSNWPPSCFQNILFVRVLLYEHNCSHYVHTVDLKIQGFGEILFEICQADQNI